LQAGLINKWDHPFPSLPRPAKIGKKIIQAIESILKNARSITRIIKNIMLKSLHDKNGREDWIDVNQMRNQEVICFDSYLYFKYRIERRYHLDPSIKKVRMVYMEIGHRFLTI